MPQVTLSGISHSFGQTQILEDINFTIASSEKVALTGANGAGKTTLLRVIAGQIRPDTGDVIRGKDTTVSYLPQSGVVLRGNTLLAEVESVYRPLFALQEQMRDLEETLGELKEDSPQTSGLLLRYHNLQEQLQRSGFFSKEELIERILIGLGFRREELARPVETFSSGWQMRIALAKVLLSRSDILLLDEPTNYLDLEARTWLEEYLTAFSGGLIVVAHDRYFLDTIVEWTVDIYCRKLNRFKGTYSEYEVKRKKELESILDQYERQQREIERIESFIRRFRYKASKARQVQSRVRALEKLERVEVPPLRKRIHFDFPETPRSGRVVLRLEDISKSFGERTVFDRIDLELCRADRLVIVGPNGAGKSTLMRIMSGELTPDRGRLVYGKDVASGYFSPENQAGASDGGDAEELSVIEAVELCAPTHLIPTLRNLLGAFLFQGDDVYKPVSVLSGGEKSRLLLLQLLLHPTNLLLLDEPTNHLDMSSKDILLDALQNYSATLVFVSHDRYFIENLASRVLELNRGKATLYAGDYRYYLWRKEREEREAKGEKGQGESRSIEQKLTPVQSEGSEAKERREREKLFKSRLRRLQREEGRILELLDELEQKKAEIVQSMNREGVYLNGDRMREKKKKLENNEAEQKALSVRWEAVAREIQKIARELD
jgi:ATP-binding cassette subfamily F protein 3